MRDSGISKYREYPLSVYNELNECGDDFQEDLKRINDEHNKMINSQRKVAAFIVILIIGVLLML